MVLIGVSIAENINFLYKVLNSWGYFRGLVLVISVVLRVQAQGVDTTAADSSFWQQPMADTVATENPNSNSERLKEYFQSVGASLQNIKVSGMVQFMAFYRNMDYSYTDMATSDRNLAFLAYPSATATGNSTGPPMMELELEGRPMAGSVFKVGFSTRQYFNGQLGDTSRLAFIRELLRFEATRFTDFGTFKLTAGGGANWLAVSPMTAGNKNFRIDPFDKLPWDWYNNSNKKYINYHKNPSIRTDERFNGAPVQGFTLEGNGLPGTFGFLVFYGKSNRSTISLDAATFLPSNLLVARVDKGIRQHKWGVNYYEQISNTDNVRGLPDNRTILTTDLKLRLSRLRLFTEMGIGKVQNPGLNSTWDPALDLRIELDKSVTKIPIFLQYYYIGRNVVSQESAVMQTNLKTPSGGYLRDPMTDNNLDLNVLQETGMLSNNRQGGVLKIEEKFGPLKVEFGTSSSLELQNVSNIVSVQQRLFSFTRSRFRPFTNATGPYQRISNRNRRSYDRIAITDTVMDYQKGYNTLDLGLKYKVSVFKRDLILANYSFLGSAGAGFSPVPLFDDKAFVRTFYEEFTAFYLISKKVVLLTSFGYERVQGNKRTVLSADNGKPVDQAGLGFGLGLDYDFANRAGLYLRHRWMDYKDANFSLDRFKGQETHIELKVYF